MAGMLNAYMAYNFLRTQFTEAVEYSNIMQSAHSILRVADSDLATFEGRFDRDGPGTCAASVLRPSLRPSRWRVR